MILNKRLLDRLEKLGIIEEDKVESFILSAIEIALSEAEIGKEIEH